MPNTPSLKSVRDRCQPAIERELLGFLQRCGQRSIHWNAEMAQYQLSTGGKRLRALIPCWVYSACGREPLQAVRLGCALEIIHNATLVHDDLQDGDALRRGQPTVWRKYSPAQAINCGDAMFQFGLRMLHEAPLEPAYFRPLALRMSDSITRVIEGQAQELLLKNEEIPSVSRYLEVIEGKTAALIASSLSLAAESLGKEPALCAELDEAGTDLGLLFQMQDDLLDVYGDKGRDRRGADVAEGKISILVAQLLEDATAADRDRALLIVRKPREQTTPGDIQDVIGLFDRYETLERVLLRIDDLRRRIAASESLMQREPALHALLGALAELFLEPIQHLLSHRRPDL